MLYVIQVCWQLASRIRTVRASSWFYYKNISQCTVTWTSNFLICRHISHNAPKTESSDLLYTTSDSHNSSPFAPSLLKHLSPSCYISFNSLYNSFCSLHKQLTLHHLFAFRVILIKLIIVMVNLKVRQTAAVFRPTGASCYTGTSLPYLAASTCYSPPAILY